MNTREGQAATAVNPGAAHPGPGVVSSGWLAANSTFGQRDQRRIGAGMGASIALHGAIAGILLLVVALTPQETLQRLPDQFALVFMQEPGPGGGGGGSPEAAPPKPLEVAPPKAAEPDPVPVPVPIDVPPPPPQLVAPVLTPNATTIQASGMSSVSLAQFGGAGRGRGVGSGTGRGIGEGEGGGTGGGVYQLGAGIVNPKVLRESKPTYTPEAMRAKIQGVVLLQVVILDSGLVGDVKVIKSLDPGLDQEAMKAARNWLFQPATKDGKPVPVYAQLELNFRIF
jgi:TonB family protein